MHTWHIQFERIQIYFRERILYLPANVYYVRMENSTKYNIQMLIYIREKNILIYENPIKKIISMFSLAFIGKVCVREKQNINT